jgi:hypothetical protein
MCSPAIVCAFLTRPRQHRLDTFRDVITLHALAHAIDRDGIDVDALDPAEA